MVNKMNGESVDLTAQNIARLKELFPEILTDGEKIDFDMLKTVLGGEVDSENERYQFTWHGKKKMIAGTQKPSKGTLRPDKEKSKNFDTTENLYIEGDNLEVLKLLQKSYNGKIKMIYIDPPYNTGQDFVYKDNFNDGVKNYLEQTGQVDASGNLLSTNTERNGRFHTDWLNMIYSRLKLARNLLCDDGVIFVSIDDSELYNLKKLCDEIFGEKCFLGNVVRATGTTTGQDSGGFGSSFDYMLAYSKNIDFVLGGLPLSEDDEGRFNLEDEKGKFSILQLRKTGNSDRRTDRPNMYYAVTAPDNSEVYPIGPGGYESRWRVGKETYQKLLDENMIYWKQTVDKGFVPYVKYYLEGRTKRPSGLWNDIDGNKKASIHLKELLDEKIFDFPKPVELLERCLHISNLNDNDIILDFFSGSATTAEAVIKFNAEESKNCKFIMIQLPEKLDEKSDAYKNGYYTICDIGEERIRRAGEKIKEELIQKQQKSGMLDENVVDPESLDIGFKVLKLDTSNIREWNVDFADLEDKLDLYDTPFVENRSELDVVYEIMLKQGLELTYPIETFEVNGQTVYDIAYGSLFVCLSQKITTDIAKAIIARRDEQGTDTSSVIFSDAGFATDSDKLSCIEILKDAGYPEDNLLTL